MNQVYQQRSTRVWSMLAVSLAALLLMGAGCGGGTNTGGILKSIDLAETWEAKNYLGQQRNRILTIDGVNINRVRINPVNPSVMYLATLEGGIYKTDTGGEQWYQLPLNSGLIRDVQIHPTETNTVYATLNNQVIKTTDGGTTWEGVYTDVEGATLTRLAIDWFQPNRVFAATSSGKVLLTENAGTDWRVTYDVNGQISDLVMSTFDSRTLFITEIDRSIHRTQDGGANWTDLFHSPQKEEDKQFLAFLREHPNVESVKTIALDANNPATIYAATGYGMLRSSDLGNTWQDVKTLIAPKVEQNAAVRNITTIPTQSGVLLFTIGNQIHKSIDGGSTWKTIDNFPSAKTIANLAVHPQDRAIIFAGTQEAEKKKNSLFFPY